jgi:hypothetical protein
LGLKRNEPIVYTLLSKVEERIGNVSFYCSGDYTYTSKHNRLFKLHLKLINGHYTIDYRVNKKSKFYYSEEQPFIFVDGKNNQVFAGENIINVNDENIQSYTKNHFILKPDNRSKLSIEEQYKNYINMINTMKEKTNGKINMYKTGNIKSTALYLLDITTKHIEPDQIFHNEGQWILESTTGGIIFNTPYEGTAYKWDIVSMFPSILQSNNFMVPIKEGTFQIMTNETFKSFVAKGYFPIGIYRIHIEKSSDDKINRLFRFNRFNKYTNVSIKHALKLGLKINLIEDSVKRINLS